MSENVQSMKPAKTTKLLFAGGRIIFSAVLLIIAVVDFLINIIRGRKPQL